MVGSGLGETVIAMCVKQEEPDFKSFTIKVEEIAGAWAMMKIVRPLVVNFSRG